MPLPIPLHVYILLQHSLSLGFAKVQPWTGTTPSMGRCNNRRTRQQAEENKNTAARARFSKGPPKKPSNGRGNGRGRGDAAETTKANVVQKIVKRVDGKTVLGSTSSSLMTRRRHPLDGVDISKLDEVILSDDSIMLVTRILQDLNVMDSKGPSRSTNMPGNDDACFEVFNSEGAQDGSRLADSGGYTEADGKSFDVCCAPVSADQENLGRGDVSPQTSDDGRILDSPHFLHLTVKLSFSKSQALRACQGLRAWDTSAGVDKDASLTGERLALAMDWLCLHLTDEELKDGFKINSNSLAKRSSTGILLVGSGRTRSIPHESIAIAKPLTSDTGWRESARLESRKLSFIRLGFVSHECEHALSKASELSVKHAEDDEAELRIMLEVLEGDALKDEKLESIEFATPADFDFAKDEQHQECRALEAIFEDGFQQKKSTHPLGRCMIKIAPQNELQSPGNSDMCWLHVFPREGYPLLASPLLLFSNPTLPPSLLRRINYCLAKQARQLIGEPAIFSLVDFLSSTLRKFQKDFVQEQLTKEMETDQLKSRSGQSDKSMDEKHRQRHKASPKGIDGGYNRVADSPVESEETEVQARAGASSMKPASARTSEFMARLRESYEEAASLKGTLRDGSAPAHLRAESKVTSSRMQILLSEAKSSSSTGTHHDGRALRIPDPIPIPTGDLREIMKDVIDLQREQPWLISGEARVPNDVSEASDLTIIQNKERTETSKRLRVDLERKYDTADRINRQNQGDERYGQSSSAPERFHRMLCQRRRLPTFQMRDEIIRFVNANQVCVISGDTGCGKLIAMQLITSPERIRSYLSRSGKTTQVPQLILDDLIWKGRGAEVNMIVTQPRRISAIGVAERVSAERCEKVGETTGYSIRLENKRSSKTRILLCTTGILLRRLQCDPDLASISHIFVDEVHERGLNTDFLLIILKDLLARR